MQLRQDQPNASGSWNDAPDMTASSSRTFLDVRPTSTFCSLSHWLKKKGNLVVWIVPNWTAQIIKSIHPSRRFWNRGCPSCRCDCPWRRCCWLRRLLGLLLIRVATISRMRVWTSWPWWTMSYSHTAKHDACCTRWNSFVPPPLPDKMKAFVKKVKDKIVECPTSRAPLAKKKYVVIKLLFCSSFSVIHSHRVCFPKHGL